MIEPQYDVGDRVWFAHCKDNKKKPLTLLPGEVVRVHTEKTKASYDDWYEEVSYTIEVRERPFEYGPKQTYYHKEIPQDRVYKSQEHFIKWAVGPNYLENFELSRREDKREED